MALTADDLTSYMQDDLGVDMGDIEPGTPLFSSGLIDSFAMVSLITYIEDRCSLRMNADDVNLDNLDSIERILDYVARAVA